jgi:hypothetical protein
VQEEDSVARRKTSKRQVLQVQNKGCKALYLILLERFARFISLDRLKEVAHAMDTQVNESFNNTASWIAPKNKVYCGSQSLKNRLSVAIGINKLGIHEYYKRLFLMLGISMTKNVTHFLQHKDRSRTKRLVKIKTKEQKKHRLKDKLRQLADDTSTARRERSKMDGTYRTGQNLDCDEEQDEDRPVWKKRASTNRKDLIC